MAVRQVAPVWTIVAAALTLLLAISLWRNVSTPKRMLLLLGVILAGASATMARLNYFEWMFHHLLTPGFEEVTGSKLDSSEMVMAVRLGEDLAARGHDVR